MLRILQNTAIPVLSLFSLMGIDVNFKFSWTNHVRTYVLENIYLEYYSSLINFIRVYYKLYLSHISAVVLQRQFKQKIVINLLLTSYMKY